MSFNPKHILVPVAIEPDDNIELAEHALMCASDLALKFNSKITILHLVPHILLGPGAGIDVSGRVYHSMEQVLKAQIERGRELLQIWQKKLEMKLDDVDIKLIDSFESAPSIICEAAIKLKVDLLIIASHGRHGLSKMFFGSVAEKVANKSSCPVLLLHPFSFPHAQEKGLEDEGV